MGGGKGRARLAGHKVHDKRCVLKLAEYPVLFMKYLAQNRVRALTCGWPGELMRNKNTSATAFPSPTSNGGLM